MATRAISHHPAAAARPQTYGLADIMRMFGQARHTQRWQIAYAERLIAAQGFPKPLPLPLGEALTDAVRPKSRWIMAAVDRWFDDRTPPVSETRDAIAAKAAGDVMDSRASSLAAQILARHAA